MGHYSDPTANMALGRINRQFSKIEKQVRRLWQLHKEGKLSREAFDRAVAPYQGIYKQAVRNGMKPKEQKSPPEE